MSGILLKQKLKGIIEKMNLNLNTILMSLYVSFVWFAYLFAYYLDECSNFGVFLILVLFMTVISFLVIPKIMAFAGKIEIKSEQNPDTKKKAVIFLVFSFIAFIYLYIWYMGYAPGGFHADSLGQYQQVMEGWWHDWNPVWHTIVCFGIPIWLTGKVSSIIIFQIIYCALIFGYMAETVYEYAGLKISVISLLAVILNPFVCINAMIADKDVDFGLACLFALICAVRIYLSNREWEKWYRIAALAFSLGCAFLFRHNGPLFAIAMVIALFFIMSRKKWIVMTALFLVMIIGIKGPLYDALQTTRPGERVVETVGLPLTIIGNVVVEHPEALDEETDKFVHEIASQEAWETYYVCGDFNEIKFRDEIHLGMVEDIGRGQVLKYMFKCIKASPQAALRAAFRLTLLTYGIDGETMDDYHVTIGENKFNIEPVGNMNIKSLCEVYNSFCRESFLKYFCRYTGITNLVILLFMLAKKKLNNAEDWKCIGIVLPVLAYTYGTTLLLTAPDMRFFVVNFMTYPLIVTLLLSKRKEEV